MVFPTKNQAGRTQFSNFGEHHDNKCQRVIKCLKASHAKVVYTEGNSNDHIYIYIYIYIVSSQLRNSAETRDGDRLPCLVMLST